MLEKTTEYDLDSDDESFRSELNVQMKNKTTLNENTFEKLIDTFEKEFFKQVLVPPSIGRISLFTLF